MKFNLLVVALFVQPLVSAFAQNKEVSITGSIKGNAPTEIIYRFLDNDVISPEHQAKVDASGMFRLKFTVDKPSFAYIIIPDVKSGTMIVEPGETYGVNFSEEEKGFFTVTGKNDIGINLYNASASSEIYMETRPYKKDTVPGTILSGINAKKNKELDLYDALRKSNSISSDFHEFVKNDRACFYASVIAEISRNKMRDPKQGAQRMSKDFAVVLQKIYEEYPPAQLDYKSPSWTEYARGYVGYNLSVQPGAIMPGGDMRHGEDYTRQQNFFINTAGKLYSGKALESIISTYLDFQVYLLSFNENYEAGFIPLFENFKKSYPTSKYNEPFESYVKKIKALESIETTSPEKAMNFLSTPDPSLKEVLTQLKGKSVYIDLWATWCVFCKKEFKMVDPQSTLLLKENGVAQLYISIDKKDKEELWKKMVQFYQLNGTHVLAGTRLTHDLDSVVNNGKPYGIPRYLLVDRNGNIVTNNAPRLSDPAQLRKALSQLY